MIEKLKKIESKLASKFIFDYDMSKSTWFRAGGKAKAFIVVENKHDLDVILQSKGNIPIYVLGAGSNLLVRDNGFEGIIIKLGREFNKVEIIEDKIMVGASILDINLSNFAKKNRIIGFEFYTGIPGTIGGAIKMNAGCFGSQTSDLLQEVSIINSNNIISKKSYNDLDMKYRSTNISDSDIITSAIFSLKYGNIDNIEKKINFIKDQRLIKQPIKEKTSGSTFKNPPNYFAAKLIDQSDCKNLSFGDAMLSSKHSNFLINKGNATAKNLEDLGNKIIEKVFDKFHIKLEWEIKIIGA